jgi:SAM-dependent methyltransferase
MTSNWSEHVGRAWRESAPFWASNGAVVRQMFDPITTALLAHTALAAGHRVLDVAGGPGEPTMTVAERVGVSGLVVHTDFAEGMVAAARHEAARLGLDNTRFAVASGVALPFADASFDRVVCRLGLMFLPDPTAGLAEMIRVVRPGARVAVAVWGSKERNPYFAVPAEIASRHAPSPDAPAGPDPWDFGMPGHVARLLEAAGAERVEEQRVAFDIAAPLDFDRFWTVRVELSDTLRNRVAAVSDAVRQALADDVREATRAYFVDATMRFPAEAVVIAGFRPDSPS